MKNKLVRLLSVGVTSSLLLINTSCQLTPCCLKPDVACTPPPCVVRNPSAFLPLNEEEYCQEWAKELLIGDTFAREWDLYRAITSYKRALILIPPEREDRRLQLYYDIALCYYLGNKYEETIQVFETSSLPYATPTFSAFDQLLLMIYDCYLRTGQEIKAEALMAIVQKLSPETSADLTIYTNLAQGKLCEAQAEVEQHPDFTTLQPYLDDYYQQAKSPTLARRLNAILPGAGYYYVGQTQSAVTSFLINTLFIWATYEFFHHGYPAAGIITASLESGWYIGGINGAGIEAQEFNNRLYNDMSQRILKSHYFFPVLKFETTF